MTDQPSLFSHGTRLGRSTAAAQDVFPQVEGIAGHTGVVHKAKGSLVIGDSELKFTTKDGSLLFSIPLSGVTEVSNQTDVRDASLGKKLLFGVFASSRKQESFRSPMRPNSSRRGLSSK